MRDKRRRGPGRQEPDDQESLLDWQQHSLDPWASGAANDNGEPEDLQQHLKLEDDLAHDFSDEATTIYHKQASPRPAAKPARRPSARYGRPNTYSTLPPRSMKDEPRFGIEGSLPRSLRPGHSGRSRNYPIVIAGLLFVGLGALWTAHGPAWSRTMLSISPHSSSVASSRTPLGQGHVVEPAPVAATSELPLEPAPTDPQQDAPSEDPAEPAVMEFELTEVPDTASEEPPAETKHEKRGRAKRSHRWSARARVKARRAHNAAVSKPIEPLVESEEDYQEPVYYRAAVNEGTLQVNSRPWARVLVDGRFMGHTPQRALQLPVGRHRVQLVNEQLDMSKRFDVVIMPGEVVTRVELLDENAHSSR